MRPPDLEQAMRRVKDRGLLFERSLARVLAAEVARLEGALEMGQRNCDDVYNDLRKERDEARIRAASLAAQLAECAGYIASVRTDRQLTRDGDVYALQTLDWAEGAREIAEKANEALEAYDGGTEGAPAANTVADSNPDVDLIVTDHETGKSYCVKTGPHLELHAEAMERVKAGQDAWTRMKAGTEGATP